MIEAFFTLVAIVNRIICVIRLFRSPCTSGTLSNINSEYIKPALNTSSESEKSELDMSEFGNPEFMFQVRVLKTCLLKRTPVPCICSYYWL